MWQKCASYFLSLSTSASPTHPVWAPGLYCSLIHLLISILALYKSRFPHLLESSGKSWIFLCKISMPWKVLEVLVQVPGRSWIFLGYDAGGRHNGAGAKIHV